jgi:chorismate-pyruvate lyase
VPKKAEKEKEKEKINLEFIKNVISMNISNPESLTDELRVFFLTVLVRMIEKKNLSKNSKGKSIADWAPEVSSDYIDEIN